MKPGPILRRAFGRRERWATGIYRRFFIDLRAFATELAEDLNPTTILDLGCGEGQSTEALADAFAQASIVGLDITPRVGRLFRGDSDRVKFVQQELQAFSADHQRAFDLAVICDVLHHIPVREHDRFLEYATACIRPDGWLVLKEWEPSANVAHLLCYLSDRFLTGDRGQYASRPTLRQVIERGHKLRVVRETSVRPWANNVVLWARSQSTCAAS